MVGMTDEKIPRVCLLFDTVRDFRKPELITEKPWPGSLFFQPPDA